MREKCDARYSVCLGLNIQGMCPSLRSKSFYKLQMLKDEVLSLKQQSIFVPFIAITESWVKPCISDGQLYIDNYSVFRADREVSKNGGVLLYVHNSIIIDTSSTYDDNVCSAVICLSKSRKCIISSVYRPPGSSDASFKNLVNFIQKFFYTHNNTSEYSTLIFGDFNLPNIHWDELNYCFPKCLNLCLEAFKNFIDNNFLVQYVHDCTRKTNILDLFLTDNPNFVDCVKVRNCSYSDHNLVNIYTSFFSPVKDIASPSTELTGLNFSLLNFNNVNWESINNDFLNMNWDQVISCPLNDFPENFRKDVFSVLSRHCKINKVYNGKKVFLSRDIGRVSRKIFRLKSKIKYSDCNVHDREKFSLAISDLVTQKKQLFFEHMFSEEVKATEKIKSDSKYFFKYVNRYKHVSPNSPKIIVDENENTVTDLQEIADSFQNQFKSVFSTPFNSHHLNTYNFNSDPVSSSISSFELTQKHIIDAIDEIKFNSSSPKGDIPARVFKNCKISLSVPLMLFWKKSFACGKIPKYYKNQMIIPLHKKGTKTNVKNFRPVSLTPHEVKIKERVIRKVLMEYLEEFNLINDNQHGFRQNRSCATQLLSQLDFILSNSVEGYDVDSIYIDFAKAFDKVDHGLLIQKLNHYGIRGNFLNWIVNFLDERTQTVFINNHFSYSTSVISGVPQGSVLGPLLFVIYNNDLSQLVDATSQIFTFADDTKLISRINSSADKVNLQNNLNNIINWSEFNNMKLNTDKFQLLRFTFGTKNLDDAWLYELPFQNDFFNYSASDIAIEPTSSVRDLGIFIDNELSWNNHYNIIVKRAKKMCGWIFSSIYSRNKEVLLTLFNSLVRGNLEYCCEVWCPHYKKDIVLIEQVQRSFTNRISGQQDYDYWQRLKNLKIYSLQRRREKLIILHVWKIKNNVYPNTVGLTFKFHKRPNAIKADIRSLPQARGKLLTIYDESFLIKACRLWNSLPPMLTKITVLSTFKFHFDKFLKNVPDEPPLPGYPFKNFNSLVEQCL